MRTATFLARSGVLTAVLAGCPSNSDPTGDGSDCRTRYYADADGDGQGDPAVETTGCEAPAGFVTDASDCDDTDPATFLGADEFCDLRDNDCDADIDEGLPGTWYLDFDNDGFGSKELKFEGCDGPDGYVTNDTDCDDTNSAIFPDAVEVCNGFDDDCDGERDDEPTDGMTIYRDADLDGFGDEGDLKVACELLAGWSAVLGDCDDTDDAISPTAAEVCNGWDDDCDDLIDDADNLVDGSAIWYLDGDLDGYGGPFTTEACVVPPGYRGEYRDCDDSDPSIHPTADELCDGVDNDCDALFDDDDTVVVGDGDVFYVDSDGDGQGGDIQTVVCFVGEGLSVNSDDCDDLDDAIYVGALEVCNGMDDDCDDAVDDEDDDRDLGLAETFHFDSDGDGVGGDIALLLCTAGDGWVASTGDCDDADPLAFDPQPWWLDGDDDGFGTGAMTTSCDAPAADWVPVGPEDCDDGDEMWRPGAIDPCDDGLDQNCNGVDASCHDPVAGDLLADDAPAILSGMSVNDNAGISMDAPGDLDGDGFGDLLIGASGADDLADRSGATLLVRGPIVGDLDLSTVGTRLLGTNVLDKMGKDVQGIGDHNGDGVVDLAVAARQTAGGAVGGLDRGTVFVFSGTVVGHVEAEDHAAAMFFGEGDFDLAGEEIAGSGDVDGDGFADLVVGAEFATVGGLVEAGKVYIQRGPLTGERFLTDAPTIEGIGSTDNTGDALAYGGDLDGDGMDEVVVGAYRADPNGNSSGQVWLHVAPFTGDRSADDSDAWFAGLESEGKFGSDLDAGGDFNGDGHSDLLVGARFEDGPEGTSQGAVHVFLGRTYFGGYDTDDADLTVWGEDAGDRLAQSINFAGDLDNDGFDDWVAGTDHNGFNGVDAGAAYIIRGPLTGELNAADAAIRVRGMLPGDGAGYEVAAGSDVDGDGYPDVVVGAYLAELGSGRMFIVYGGDL